jgi:hypothetical protein
MGPPEGIFVYRYLPIDEKIIPLRALCASVVDGDSSIFSALALSSSLYALC